MTEMLDVAIVGGGVSGLYCAWRLLGADPPAAPRRYQKVAVFEASDRIGGRLLSVKPPGMPHITCELGGMRYLSNQVLCRGLVEQVFKLAVRPFPTDLPNNLSFLRGRHLTYGQLGDGSKIPYNLEGLEAGMNPGQLLMFALQQLVPGIAKMDEARFDEAYRHFHIDGEPLYKLGFWNLLLRVLSGEAYDFVQDSSGYYSITTNWNAGDALRMFLADFAPGVTYHAINDGFETLPRRLAAQCEAAGGSIHLNHRLVSFDQGVLPDGTKGMVLRVKNQQESRTLYARKLVLAMPRRALQLLDPSGCLLGPEQVDIRHLLDAVEGIPLFKLFMAYDTPWWESVGISEGRSITTLPLRQCYYWGVEGRQTGAEPGNTNAVLLASYDDVRETDFWRGMASAPRARPRSYDSRPNRFVDGTDTPDTGWQSYAAPHRMVEEAQRQLMQLHGVRYAPAPYAAAYRDWSEDPYGGGVHFWNIGYNSLDCIPRMVKPLQNQPVFIVGEAYSKTQGWVEGALQTSELLLQQHLGLPAPAWISAS